MKTFIHEIFDSRNTSFNREIKARDIFSAIRKAKKYNIKKHIVRAGGYRSDWAEIEDGKVMSASGLPLFI